MSRSSIGDQSQSLVISERGTSWICALLCTISFLSFSVGYFFGRSGLLRDCADTAERLGMSDLVWGSALMSAGSLGEGNVSVPCDEPVLADTAVDEAIVEDLKGNRVAGAVIVASDSAVLGFVAQLIGFGTKRSADKFVIKMQQKGIDLLVQKRLSTLPSGVQRAWYQVVTGLFYDRNDLEMLVSRLSRQEHLANVKIVTCPLV